MGVDQLRKICNSGTSKSKEVQGVWRSRTRGEIELHAGSCLLFIPDAMTSLLTPLIPRYTEHNFGESNRARVSPDTRNLSAETELRQVLVQSFLELVIEVLRLHGPARHMTAPKKLHTLTLLLFVSKSACALVRMLLRLRCAGSHKEVLDTKSDQRLRGLGFTRTVERIEAPLIVFLAGAPRRSLWVAASYGRTTASPPKPMLCEYHSKHMH